MRKLFFLLFSIITFGIHSADFVLFSFDRPLQLYALLESSEKYMHELEQVVVLYRTSDQEFEKGYQELKERFSDVLFIKQPEIETHASFKPLLMQILTELCHSPYLLFSTDDIIIKDHVDLNECATALEKYRAEGFHLRLGQNIVQCFNRRINSALPPFQTFENGILRWQYNKAKWCCWRYPFTVDGTLYRKKLVMKYLNDFPFMNPNQLEDRWVRRANLQSIGLCYKSSRNVNIPINLVNETHRNKILKTFTTKDLLEKFNEGYKIDIQEFYQMENKSGHINFSPTFIPR